MGGVLARLLDSLWAKKLEMVLVGLSNSGKTTLLHTLAGQPTNETVPTIGLNVKMMKRGGVTMKCWDLGGQAQCRAEWPRYTKGCDVIVFVVDSAAEDLIALAKHELHILLEDRELANTPLLVCANKVDVEDHLSNEDIVKGLNLDYILDNPWEIIGISALRGTNLESVIDWLVKRGRRGNWH
eukprot:GFYU01001592.1.p1 GENE.GFYU01001592.1~~GFYU01001592.1.p1  ORF type:complete len:183 (-),score=28.57 GFYU01001592.1:492-1040(-)